MLSIVDCCTRCAIPREAGIHLERHGVRLCAYEVQHLLQGWLVEIGKRCTLANSQAAVVPLALDTASDGTKYRSCRRDSAAAVALPLAPAAPPPRASSRHVLDVRLAEPRSRGSVTLLLHLGAMRIVAVVRHHP